MQQLSIGELDSLVLKACRGAGYSWGLAQEAGRAAAWLACRGIPASAAVNALLQQVDGLESAAITPVLRQGVIGEARRPVCPLMTGALISDRGWCEGETIKLGQLYSPVICIPFVAACAKSAATSLRVTVADAEVFLNHRGELGQCYLTSSGSTKPTLVGQPASVVVGEAGDRQLPAAVIQRRRAELTDTELRSLEAFAHRTYVPASEQSRSGAGPE